MEHILTDVPKSNGHLDLSDIPGVMRPRRIYDWFDLTDQENYPDYRVRLWLNPSWNLVNEFASSNPELFKPLWPLFIAEHNGWLNERGEAVPQPADDFEGFANAISNDLFVKVLSQAAEVARNPRNFQRPKSDS